MFLKNKKKGCFDYETKEGTLLECVAPLMEVDKVAMQLENANAAATLHVNVNLYNTKAYSFDLPLADCADTKAFTTTLINNGCAINSPLEGRLAEHFKNEYVKCLRKGNIEYKHKRLGWYEHNGKYYYLYDQNDIDGITSTCALEDFRFSKGSRDVYERFLKDVVYPVPTLSIAMAIGYSAVLASRLNKDYDIGTIVVNFCGASSTGKTTAEQLLVSPFGCPQIINRKGLCRNFFSTDNALFSGCDSIHGLPMVLDDSTTNGTTNKANLIYTLTGGETKGRCNADGSLRSDLAGWSGVVVISSETPLSDEASENQGLKARVIQTEGITWTPDAEIAGIIKSTVQANYGFTGRDFADYVRWTDYDELCRDYETARELTQKLMKQRDNLTDRLASKYAVIYLTIQMMNKCFELNLKADELMKLLLEPEQRSVCERDIAVKGLEVIKNFVLTKLANFDVNDRSGEMISRPASGNRLGAVVKDNGICHVYILSLKVDEILKQSNINETTTVKKRWKERGITQCDAGRNDCKYNGCRHIHFKLDMNKGDISFGIEHYAKQNEQEKAPKVKMLCDTYNKEYDDKQQIEEIFANEQTTY